MQAAKKRKQKQPTKKAAPKKKAPKRSDGGKSTARKEPTGRAFLSTKATEQKKRK